jgi:hypothetical protein
MCNERDSWITLKIVLENVKCKYIHNKYRVPDSLRKSRARLPSQTSKFMKQFDVHIFRDLFSWHPASDMAPYTEIWRVYYWSLWPFVSRLRALPSTFPFAQKCLSGCCVWKETHRNSENKNKDGTAEWKCWSTPEILRLVFRHPPGIKTGMEHYKYDESKTNAKLGVWSNFPTSSDISFESWNCDDRYRR